MLNLTQELRLRRHDAAQHHPAIAIQQTIAHPARLPALPGKRKSSDHSTSPRGSQKGRPRSHLQAIPQKVIFCLMDKSSSLCDGTCGVSSNQHIILFIFDHKFTDGATTAKVQLRQGKKSHPRVQQLRPLPIDRPKGTLREILLETPPRPPGQDRLSKCLTFSKFSCAGADSGRPSAALRAGVPLILEILIRRKSSGGNPANGGGVLPLLSRPHRPPLPHLLRGAAALCPG